MNHFSSTPAYPKLLWSSFTSPFLCLYWETREGEEIKAYSQWRGLTFPLSTKQPGSNISPWLLPAASWLIFSACRNSKSSSTNIPEQHYIWSDKQEGEYQGCKEEASLLFTHFWVVYKRWLRVSFLPQDGEGKEGWTISTWRQVLTRHEKQNTMVSVSLQQSAAFPNQNSIS